MYNLRWSETEKKLSRSLFETTLHTELMEVMAEFKAKAAGVSTPEEMWAIRDYLTKRQHEITQKYNDYRYSQLILVFARLVREGRIQMGQLGGLSEDKLTYIRRIAG